MPENISRRDFIKRSALGVVAGGAALSGLNLKVLAAQSAKAVLKRSGEVVTIKLSENPDIAAVGGHINITDDIMLIRMDESKFLAISTICRHKGCTVELEGDKFVCPCHGSEYTITGKVTQGPAKANLITYETAFDSEKGTITINLPEEN
jgi:cytochrome b6-f complex iron-sulfur subunit